MAKVPIDAAPGFRAAHDPPTDLLIIDGPGFSGCMTLEQWEAAERAIRQALEALLGQRGEPDWHTGKQRENAIAALRERLGGKA
jgi:hypothetical protein